MRNNTTILRRLKRNKTLRQLKNSMNDHLGIKKYQITSFKNSLLPSSEKYLKEALLTDEELVENDNFVENHQLTNQSIKIGITVTEIGKHASAGDYFTAIELGIALQKFGYKIVLLPQNGGKNWYFLDEDIDVVISLLDVYDPRKIRCKNSDIIKIAWTRNWFDRWIALPGFGSYDLVFSTSQSAINYIKEFTGIDAILFPLATNPDRFNNSIPIHEKYKCDYCFTGSYWNYPREIMEILEPESLSYNFRIYGKNWEKNKKFKKYYHGFIQYSELPKLYVSTKIVVDDANLATKEHGSVNSRIFDALACGALVFTNGKLGAEEIFNNKLPVFSSKQEFNQLIDHFLSNDDQRKARVETLKKIVLEEHTYQERAKKLSNILTTVS